MGRAVTNRKPILITGFLGAGKTRLAKTLTDGDTWDPIELAGTIDPLESAEYRTDAPLICVADAANLRTVLKTPALGPLVEHQLRCADLVLLSRTDIVDDGPALDLVVAITDAPVVRNADQIVEVSTPARKDFQPMNVASPSFTFWQYRGPLVLQPEQAERLSEARPKACYRLSGIVQTGTGGLEIEIAGRFRQTRPVADPGETLLSGIGLSAQFRQMDMDVLLSELASDAAARRWIFNHR